MIDAPTTKAEASRVRYGCWAGDPNGRPYDSARCAYSVYGANRWIPAQCTRKPGHGPDELYCKIHAKRVQVHD